MPTLAIAGSRTIYPTIDLVNHISPFAWNKQGRRPRPEEITIITGGATGVDAMAEKYAQTHGMRCITILPDYHRYGRSAPIIRNKQIVEAADIVLVYWDHVSRGTKFVLDYATKIGKPIQLHLY